MLGVTAKLGNGLGDEDVKPVQALGLVAVDLVVGLMEDRADGEGRRSGAEDAGLLFVEGRVLLWMLAARAAGGPETQQRFLVGQCLGSSFGGSYGGCDFGRGRVAEDEELDEGGNQEDDGDLAEDEALRKRETACGLVDRLFSAEDSLDGRVEDTHVGSGLVGHTSCDMFIRAARKFVLALHVLPCLVMSFEVAGLQ